ncbi:hypothetical protein ACP70R_014684 [Stipagrostis hirtigluma subsp. patula]
MAASLVSRCKLVLLVAASASALLASTAAADASGLRYDYYNETCPGVEQLVRDELLRRFTDDVTLPASLLRLHFHDCFVRGCDASVMLQSHNATAERDADPNSTLRGYEAIEAVKAAVEATCPLVVSCADIMAMAARDAVNFSQGPWYAVETGRRDGVNVSVKEEALKFLPPADGNVTVLTQYFAVQNLTMKDMTVLSGAHTLGVTHCSSFSKRLYNNTGAGDQDPAMDPEYAKNVSAVCTPGNVASVQPMDAQTPTKFDLAYYEAVYKGRALLASDDALRHDSLTGAYVQLMNNATYLETFFADFAVAMINMGRIGARTGTDGEIRATCAVYVD